MSMNKITLISAALALVSSMPVAAEPSSNVAFDAETRALLASGDPEKGKEVAANNKCNKCHSENGIAEDPDDPNLAGQLNSYLYKQLRDYQDKKRESKDMLKRTKKLEKQDLAHLAAWYASLPTPERMGKASDATLQLINKGDPKRMIKACGSCHGRKGQGGKHDAATLNGMSRGYFVTTMTEFKEEDRDNDIYSRMRNIAEPLTEVEIEALADFYATTPPPEEDE